MAVYFTENRISWVYVQSLARGKSNKDIADGMFLNNKTVSTYKTRLLLKLNARSLVDLIELAQRNGLV
jgi:two-component system response regulator EvgA